MILSKAWHLNINLLTTNEFDRKQDSENKKKQKLRQNDSLLIVDISHWKKKPSLFRDIMKIKCVLMKDQHFPALRIDSWYFLLDWRYENQNTRWILKIDLNISSQIRASKIPLEVVISDMTSFIKPSINNELIQFNPIQETL